MVELRANRMLHVIRATNARKAVTTKKPCPERPITSRVDTIMADFYFTDKGISTISSASCDSRLRHGGG